MVPGDRGGLSAAATQRAGAARFERSCEPQDFQVSVRGCREGEADRHGDVELDPHRSRDGGDAEVA